MLFDTRSIQKYIFSGNLLKTQIGASHLVAHVFQKLLVEETLCKEVFSSADVEDLSKPENSNQADALDWSQMETPCRVAYIGGGNALVLLRGDVTEETAKRIVTSFTTRLLIHCPGLHTGAAFIEHLDFTSDEAFQDSFDTLYKKLKQNQNTVFPAVHMPYTGLTHACSLSGEAADFFDARGILASGSNSHRYFSQEMGAKARDTQAADRDLRQTVSDHIKAYGEDRCERFEEYHFPLAFDRLGQRRGSETSSDPCNDIAIIHIDGNNMGLKFRECAGLSARRALSMALLQRAQRSFARLISEIMDEYETYTFLSLERDAKKYLPLRPIILGGDDITFVCAAQVAVHYTTRLMTFLAEWDDSEPVGLKKGMDCCGGIAILPTSYPFFRGYELAEQLCGAAKAEMRRLFNSESVGSSWIDFAVLHGEQPPELAQLRAREYSGVRGDLHFGPYRLDASAGEAHSTACLRAGVRALRDQLPKNKVKELRDILTRDAHTTKQFLTQLKHLGIRFPSIRGWENYGTDRPLWYEDRTPYVDAIEMIDYIPAALEKEGKCDERAE